MQLIQQAHLLGIKPTTIWDYIYLKRGDSVFSVSSNCWHSLKNLSIQYEASTWKDWIKQKKPCRYQAILQRAIESCK